MIIGLFHSQVAKDLLHISVINKKELVLVDKTNKKLQNMYVQRMYARSCCINLKYLTYIMCRLSIKFEVLLFKYYFI